MVTEVLVTIGKIQSDISTSNIFRNASYKIKFDKHLLGRSLRDRKSEVKALRVSPADWSEIIVGHIKDSSRGSTNLLKHNDVEVLIRAANVESGVLARDRSSIKSDVVSFPSNSSSTVVPIRDKAGLSEGNGEENKNKSEDGLHL